MPIYAQLNMDEICVGVSCLSGEVNLPTMVLLTEKTVNPEKYIGKQYRKGKWTLPQQVTPVRITIISFGEFLDRLTKPQQILLYAAMKDRIDMQIWFDRLRARNAIDLTDKETYEQLRIVFDKDVVAVILKV